MMLRQWETELTEVGEVPLEPPARLGSQSGPARPLLGQVVLDKAVQALQEDLALLQTEQERGLNTLGGALAHINEELTAVRDQLAALAEPLLAAKTPPDAAAANVESVFDRRQAETEARFERLEKQVALLIRGMDTVDTLRFQSDVHTRALARLTDLLGEVVKPKPIEGLEPLQKAVASLEQTQQRSTRLQTAALVILGVGLTPGLGALGWLILRGSGAL
jgi:uncharacterized coiled-coil protein SlyX